MENVTLYIGTQDEPEDRTKIVVTPEEAEKIKGPKPFVVTLTDVDGKQHTVRDADCGLGCRCALEFVPTLIPHDPQDDEPEEESSPKPGITVYVNAWASSGSGGFDWWRNAEHADKDFELDCKAVEEHAAEQWTAYRFDYQPTATTYQGITDEIDGQLIELCAGAPRKVGPLTEGCIMPEAATK